MPSTVGMEEQESPIGGKDILLWAIILFLCAILTKAFYLSSQIFGSLLDPRGLWFLVNDLPPICLTTLIFGFASFIRSRRYRRTLEAVGLAFFGLYLADSILIATVNLRLSPGEVAKYFSHVSILFPLLRWPVILLGLVSAVLCFFPVRVPHFPFYFLLVLALSLFLFSEAVYSRSHVLSRRYGWNLISSRWTQSSDLDSPDHFYSEQQVEHYLAKSDDWLHADLEISKPLILLVVESLSASDSLKASGIANLLPKFDALTEQGIFFPNGIANYPDSEGGLISLMGGVAPIPYVGSSRNLYLSFRSPESPVRDLVRRGYKAFFATNAGLSWIYKTPYLESLGFHEIYGPENTKYLANQKRYTCDDPPDGALYSFAREQLLPHLSGTNDPFLLVLATVSSHRPYLDPLERSNTREAVMQYVDDQLGRFVEDLRSSGFLNKGTLLIVGDHRRMEPVSIQEYERYGDSAVARIPLLILGADVKKPRIDRRLFQQVDLLRYYSRFINEAPIEISPHPMFIDRYARLQEYLPGERGRITVFAKPPQSQSEALDSFPLRVVGNSITWEKELPRSEPTNEYIHRLRATFQSFSQRGISSARCGDSPLFASWTKTSNLGVSETRVDLQDQTKVSTNSIVENDGRIVQLSQELLKPGTERALLSTFEGYLELPEDGEYRLALLSETPFCVFLPSSPIFDKNELGPFRDPQILPSGLPPGLTPFAIRYWYSTEASLVSKIWISRKGEDRWRPVTEVAKIWKRE